MGMFLNSCVPYEGYREVLRDTYFVDKSSKESKKHYCKIEVLGDKQ